MINSFYEVFNERLKKLKKKLKTQLDKTKKDRDKRAMKSIIAEAKSIRDALKQFKKEEKKCPNCGCKLEND